MPDIKAERVLNPGYFRELSQSFPDVSWDAEKLRAFVEGKDNLLLAARVDQKMAGFVRAHVLSRYDNKGNEVLLHEIDVLPEFRKQGVATAMVEALKKIAQQMSASEMWVITNKSNVGAMALYHATGGKEPHDDDIVLVYELQT